MPLHVIYTTTDTLETIFPEALLTVAGTFSQANLKQFAYRCNRSTEDAISLALHSSLEHQDNKDTYIRLLLIDYSSTFITIIASRLISKLCHLGLSSTLCNQILSFLTHRPQSVRT
eukprot:g36460.t1